MGPLLRRRCLCRVIGCVSGGPLDRSENGLARHPNQVRAVFPLSGGNTGRRHASAKGDVEAMGDRRQAVAEAAGASAGLRLLCSHLSSLWVDMASHGSLSQGRRCSRRLAAARGSAMPLCDAHRARGRPTWGRFRGAGSSGAALAAFQLAHSPAGGNALSRAPAPGRWLPDSDPGRRYASTRHSPSAGATDLRTLRKWWRERSAWTEIRHAKLDSSATVLLLGSQS